MIILETERLILRDFEEKDIEKRVFWETVETEWKKWDAPWLREFDIVKEKGMRSAAWVKRRVIQLQRG